MPLYSYECSNCGWSGDLISSHTDRDKKSCQECKNDLTRDIINKGTSFDLKGSGWFKDGYQKSKQD